MTRIFKSTLLIGTAVLSLAACAGDKGPGSLGSKDDIVVRNHGAPPLADPAAAVAAAPQTGDFTSTIEQGEAVPAPEVAAAEALTEAASPVTQEAAAVAADASAAVQENVAAANAYVDSAAQAALPVAEPVVAAAPAVIPPTPESAPAVTGNVYPATDYPAAQAAQPVPAPAPEAAPVYAPAPQPVAQPVQLPEGVKYPLDANAPYSPKAVEAAIAASGAVAAAAPTAVATGNPSDSATIRAAQTALKAKGQYTGAETGSVDAAFLNALIMYQAKNGLPQGGLNEATLRSLGVIQ